MRKAGRRDETSAVNKTRIAFEMKGVTGGTANGWREPWEPEKG